MRRDDSESPPCDAVDRSVYYQISLSFGTWPRAPLGSTAKHHEEEYLLHIANPNLNRFIIHNVVLYSASCSRLTADHSRYIHRLVA